MKEKIWTAVLILGVALMLGPAILAARALLGYRMEKAAYQSLAAAYAPETILSESCPSGACPAAQPQRNIDWGGLEKENREICAWITIPALEEVNYPVVQHADNAYYLTHTYQKKESGAGAIFLDAAAASDFSGLHAVLYGHNRKDGSMFGTLKAYTDADFYRKNGGEIQLYTPAESWKYEIYSVEYVHENDPETYRVDYQSDAAYAALIQAQKQDSLYDTGVSVPDNASTLTLSTCCHSPELRLVIHAVRIETE